MPGPAIVVMIPESTRKNRASDTKSSPRDDFAGALPSAHRASLDKLRDEVHRKSPQGSIGTTGLLPAYRRFDGNMYRHIPLEAWEGRTPGVEVLIVSGLFGAVLSRDAIPWYEHSMAEPFGDLGKLNRWWHGKNLPDIVRAYLDRVAPEAVVDLLSLEYREAVAGFSDGLRAISVKTIDFPGLGRASQPRRGERVADILRTGRV